MRIITIESITELIKKRGFDNFMIDLMKALKHDFSNWESFTKIPRPAMHVPDGVLELMPICDNKKYYTFKYVNCHPKNPLIGEQTVVATGQLSRIDTGYPLLYSEMTILTALRTSATAAIATDFMARKNAHVVAMIGTGAQSEFQIKGLELIRDITEVRYFDIDEKAMDKFANNMKYKKFALIRCRNAQEAVKGADIITVCTAAKEHVDVIKNGWIEKGVHINGIGGDCPGKTELDLDILSRSRLIVEYFEQSFIEGEIQRLDKNQAKQLVYAELHELIKGSKIGRGNEKEITLFDSVGVALEDYSALRLTYELAEKYNIGEEKHMIPDLKDPKDLISALQ